FFCVLTLPPPPCSTLFPYTTLFRSKTVFINTAGQSLLGSSEIGVPIFKQAEVYRLNNESGTPLDAKELPAAQALSSGKSVQDRTDRKSTRLNSSHRTISYAVFCLKK